MTLLDRLRNLNDMPPDTDLAVFFGLKPGDPFRWDGQALTIGDETAPINDARAALGLAPLAQVEPRRTVEIGDL
jgi:hypothetical protein